MTFKAATLNLPEIKNLRKRTKQLSSSPKVAGERGGLFGFFAVFFVWLVGFVCFFFCGRTY